LEVHKSRNASCGVLAHIETSGSRGGLLKRPARTPPPECGTNAFVCSIQVESFDATAGKIEDLGGVVALPKFAVPEGNTFGIFEVDEKAG
jgi:predicted enzyme related to lactoylglutathione lyase